MRRDYHNGTTHNRPQRRFEKIQNNSNQAHTATSERVRIGKEILEEQYIYKKKGVLKQ